MLCVESREYKCMLDPRLFADADRAAKQLRRDLKHASKTVKRVNLSGHFEASGPRTIEFLDTPDQTIALNRLIFRRRVKLSDEQVEYTLKCRSPDRHVAAAAKVSAADGLKANPKFEEDIGPPFAPRFSHSCTVEQPGDAPQNLHAAAELFPLLGKLKRDDERCSGKVAIDVVNATRIHEQVWKKFSVAFHETPAEIAFILWSDGPRGRPLVCEFSFRYTVSDDEVSPKAAEAALRFFEYVQRLDWAVPDARSKTQFAYAAG